MDPQNVNARYLDKFGSDKTTSVKIHHPPGGKSSFSLGWEEPVEKPKKKSTTNYDNSDNYSQQSYPQEEKKVGKKRFNNQESYSNNDNKTSVKVSNPSGGQSSFVFGCDNSKMDDFRKKK